MRCAGRIVMRATVCGHHVRQRNDEKLADLRSETLIMWDKSLPPPRSVAATLAATVEKVLDALELRPSICTRVAHGIAPWLSVIGVASRLSRAPPVCLCCGTRRSGGGGGGRGSSRVTAS